MNHVVLIGRIANDLELRKTAGGTSVISFSLAVNRYRKVEGQPDADFINCTVWGKTADNLYTYQKKGSLIAVQGRIQIRSYEDRQGKKVYVTEVVADDVQFLGSKKEGETNKQTGYATSLTAEAEKADALDITSDDLPF